MRGQKGWMNKNVKREPVTKKRQLIKKTTR